MRRNGTWDGKGSAYEQFDEMPTAEMRQRGREREREREILEVVFAAAAAAAATQTTGVGKRNGDTYFKVG